MLNSFVEDVGKGGAGNQGGGRGKGKATPVEEAGAQSSAGVAEYAWRNARRPREARAMRPTHGGPDTSESAHVLCFVLAREL